MAEPKQVLIVMGSDSDLPVMREARDALAALGIGCETRVLSAHRTPERTREAILGAEAAGFRVVIGVPIASGALHGVDALYSTVQMPPGVPVATVAVGGGKNAGLLAAQILAVSDPRLREALKADRARMSASVEEKDRKVREELK